MFLRLKKIFFGEKTEVTLFLAFLAAGLLLIPLYKTTINVDGVQYMSLAKKYLNGNFPEAINGLWSPLLPWMMVPFLLIKINPIVSFKIITVLSGVFVLFEMNLILSSLNISKKIKILVLLSSVFMLLYYALVATTPDLLQLSIILAYFLIVFDSDYIKRISVKRSIFIGVLGAFAYFAKAYNFYFFLIHFFIFNLYIFINGEEKEIRGKILKSFGLSLITFLVIASPWVALLSNKYGFATISNAGRINHAWVGKEREINQVESLNVPPNQTAMSLWEDPSFLKLKQWNPLWPLENFEYQMKIVGQNILKMREFFYYLFSTLIILAVILQSKAKFSKELSKKLNFLVFTMVLYILGYLPIGIQPRYIWFSYMLLLIMNALLLNFLFTERFFTNSKKILFVVILFVFWIFIPVERLFVDANFWQKYSKIAQSLSSLDIKGNIASNYGTHEETFYVSYYLDSPYYGQIKSGENSEELCADLNKYSIDYYFNWQSKNSPAVNCANYQKFGYTNESGLEIYGKNGEFRQDLEEK
jgi:hypothetical protein